LGEAHRQYTRMINFREKWRGYLWQGRFHSFAMDEEYFYRCVRYVEQNPVRAGLVKNASKWKWSSATAHLKGKDDGFVMVKPMLERISNWQKYLDESVSQDDLNRLRSHSNTGRPSGDDQWIEGVEQLTGRMLKKKKPGPKANKI